MTDTSGRTSPAPFATYDPVSSCWKTSETTSLWALTLSSLTLPAWGGLAAGELSELPTPELPTIGPASLLLRTPTAQLATNGGSQHPDKRKAGGHGPTLADEVEHLLPTPTARDHKGANQRGDVTCLHGALIGPQSHDGSASPDDQHQPLLRLDGLALPA